MPKVTRPIPVYIPWATFTDFLSHLKTTRVPSRIDKSIMSQLPALTRGQMLTTLRFLRLIDRDGSTSSGKLRSLVEAYETDRWAQALQEIVVPRYERIIGDLNLESATPHQLDECFDQVCDREIMRQKSVRFYLTVLTSASVAFSPHLLKPARDNGTPRRRARPPSARRSKKTTKRPKHSSETPEPKDAKGTKRYPLYFKGKADGMIVVPDDLDEADCKVIELQLAVLRAYAGVDET